VREEKRREVVDRELRLDSVPGKRPLARDDAGVVDEDIEPWVPLAETARQLRTSRCDDRSAIR
jgi:hypothetical protein